MQTLTPLPLREEEGDLGPGVDDVSEGDEPANLIRVAGELVESSSPPVDSRIMARAEPMVLTGLDLWPRNSSGTARIPEAPVESTWSRLEGI